MMGRMQEWEELLRPCFHKQIMQLKQRWMSLTTHKTLGSQGVAGKDVCDGNAKMLEVYYGFAVPDKYEKGAKTKLFTPATLKSKDGKANGQSHILHYSRLMFGGAPLNTNLMRKYIETECARLDRMARERMPGEKTHQESASIGNSHKPQTGRTAYVCSGAEDKASHGAKSFELVFHLRVDWPTQSEIEACAINIEDALKKKFRVVNVASDDGATGNSDEDKACIPESDQEGMEEEEGDPDEPVSDDSSSSCVDVSNQQVGSVGEHREPLEVVDAPAAPTPPESIAGIAAPDPQEPPQEQTQDITVGEVVANNETDEVVPTDGVPEACVLRVPIPAPDALSAIMCPALGSLADFWANLQVEEPDAKRVKAVMPGSLNQQEEPISDAVWVFAAACHTFAVTDKVHADAGYKPTAGGMMRKWWYINVLYRVGLDNHCWLEQAFDQSEHNPRSRFMKRVQDGMRNRIKR